MSSEDLRLVLLALIPAVVATIGLIYNRQKDKQETQGTQAAVNRLEISINGRLEKLLESTKVAAIAEGREMARAEQAEQALKEKEDG